MNILTVCIDECTIGSLEGMLVSAGVAKVALDKLHADLGKGLCD